MTATIPELDLLVSVTLPLGTWAKVTGQLDALGRTLTDEEPGNTASANSKEIIRQIEEQLAREAGPHPALEAERTELEYCDRAREQMREQLERNKDQPA
jgi:hypothetical protein